MIQFFYDSVLYTYICTQILLHYRLLKDIDYIFLCCIVNPCLFYIQCSVLLLVSVRYIPTLIFIHLFFLLTLSFACIFLVPLKVNLDCLFEIFLVSRGRPSPMFLSSNSKFKDLMLLSQNSLCPNIFFFVFLKINLFLIEG